LLHLAVNMYALWIFGQECERLLGRWRFLALYLLSGIGGSVAVYFFADKWQQSAGASASLFGLLGALFFLFQRMRIDLRGLAGLVFLTGVLMVVAPRISFCSL